MYTYQRGGMGNKGDNLQTRWWEAAGTGNLFDPGQIKPDMKQQLNTGTTGNSYGIGSSPVRNILVPLKLRVICSFTVLEILSPVSFCRPAKCSTTIQTGFQYWIALTVGNICKQKRLISEKDPTSVSLWAHFFHSSTNSTDKVSSLKAEISSVSRLHYSSLTKEEKEIQ